MVVVAVSLGIVALRLVDVSIGALRITYLVRGRRTLAGVLGFFESLSWVIAAALVLNDIDEWYKVLAYAAGFGLGTALGGSLDRWIASGQVFVRIMAPVASPQVAPALRDRGFGVTVLNAEGRDGEVRMSVAALPRRRLGEALQLIQSINARAFVTVDEVRADRVAAIRAASLRK